MVTEACAAAVAQVRAVWGAAGARYPALEVGWAAQRRAEENPGRKLRPMPKALPHPIRELAERYLWQG